MTSRHVGTLLMLATVGLTVLASACSSSSPKATPEFSKGVATFYTPDGAQAPTIPATMTNCLYGKASAADRAALSKATTADEEAKLADAVAVRLIRTSNQCDDSLTQQLVQAEIFTGAATTISATQRSCTTSKVISSISSIDDTSLHGSNTKTVQDATTKAAADCGVTLSSS